MHCAKCGTESTTGRKFCAACGSPLINRCPKCGAENALSSAFCEDCGSALALNEPSAALTATQITPANTEIRFTAAQPDAPVATDGERKTVTALFADIKGSTELLRDLDPEEARAIIDPALKIMIDAVCRYEGYIVQSTGDGIFALFGAPLAHEDHPQRALFAALDMQKALRELAAQVAAQGRPALEARIGVNSGEVVMRTVETGGRVEYTPVGHVSNLAARMQAIAPAGGIAISEDTRRLVEGYFELRGLGPTEIKGIAEPLSVYEITGLGPLRTHFQVSARRGLTKFVGRERELAEMKRALSLALGGQGQIVALVGEAGAGKSRLVHEFKAMLPGECKLLEAYSVSHGKASAYLPVLALLFGYFDIKDADDKAQRREKIENRVIALDSALKDTLPLLYTLMGLHDGPDPLAQMDAQIKRRRTLEAIKRIITHESLNHPIVVIFEDLHWVDSETQALLDLLADSIGNSRILLLVNYRPEYRHEWSDKSYYSQLRLETLGKEGTGEMLSALLGDSVELNPLKRLIVERTQGNPFFIEEMVQALFDEGALVRNGAVKVTRSLSQLRLPPTVQGILASRIDRLRPEHKQLLQTLAVIGRESPPALIRQVASVEEPQLERMLADLQRGEFIYEQAAPVGVVYAFKHALTQEVAYNSLLIERRKHLHERVGQVLESIFADQMDDQLTHLAHHYGHSENLEKAVEYLGRAGQQALQRSAHTEAIKGLTAAVDLLRRLPDGPDSVQRELSLQLALAGALIPLRGFTAPEVESACLRARELCERVDDPPELFPVLIGLWSVYYLRGELRTAHELAEQLLHGAHRAHDSGLLMLAHGCLGDTLCSMGEFSRSREHLEMGISLYDPERHSAFRYTGIDPGVNDLSYLAITLWLLGYANQALERGNEALALAQLLSHPHSLAFAKSFVGRLHQWRGEAREAQRIAETLITLSIEHGFTFWLAQATCERGAAMTAQGHYEAGTAEMQEGLAALSAIDPRAQFLRLIAEAFIEMGRLDEALKALTEGLAIADTNCELHRLKGELLLRQDALNVLEARSCFQRAIEIARNQSAKFYELRATMSLAGLLAKQGRRDEARNMLAEIYGWFTEGFDTADLKEAKALLDEMSA